MTWLRTLENSKTSRCRSLMRLFVFLVLPKSSTVLAKNSTSFRVGGKVLHNGNTKNNDFA